MTAIEGAQARSASTLRRLPILLLLSIPAAAATVWDEVLLAGPIIVLVEALGFALGLVTFAIAWACVGLGLLSLAELLWPRLRPALNRGARKAASMAAEWWEKTCELPREALAVVGGLGLLASVFTSLNWLVEPGRLLLQKHSTGLGAGLLVVLLVVVLAAAADVMRQRVEAWVRRIAHAGRPILRVLAALLAMVYLGPVLAWPLFRLLGYSRRTIYLLTAAAAPVFAGIWVPYYSFGPWRLIQEAFT